MDFMSDDVSIEDINLNNEVLLQVTSLAKKKRARAGKYTTTEDETLVLAWDNRGLDPMVWTNRDKSTYWDRILQPHCQV